MNQPESSLLPINQEDINQYKEELTSYLKQVSWKADNKRFSDNNENIDLTFLIGNKTLGLDQTDEISILKNAIRISDDRILLSNTTNYVINAVREGFCLGKHISKLYEKASGLEQLQERNKNQSIHQSELPEFHEKTQTQSAILTFVASKYIIYLLDQHRKSESSAININFGGIPEINISRPSQTISCGLYYYGAYLERSNVVNNELELLQLSNLYFQRLSEEVVLRKDSLKFSEFFTNKHYKVEETEFTIQGFDPTTVVGSTSQDFNPIRMEQIIANKEAKHMFKRYAERLLCYDMKTGQNPMLELGGLPAVTMADGKPGTGKSMLIAATATILKEKCEELEIPFLFWPLPDNIISTYQGGSAERAMEWFRPMQDKNKIIFAPVDDAENNLEERTRKGVSAGVRELIGVFLRNTEGAYAINNGNRLISLFTNIPDQIDKAVLSRIQSRVSMDGATTKEDFIDQDYIWWKKYGKMMPDFVDAIAPKNYEFMEAQKELTSLNSVFNKEYEFVNEEVKDIFDSTLSQLDPKSHDFFGSFYQNVLKKYSFFSSRDLRNIQKAVDSRIIDFDMPEEWWDDSSLFFKQGYDTKMEMLKKLTIENMGELTFSEIRLREALFYIDTAVRINNTGLNREIDETAKQMFVNEKAREEMRKKYL
ncbi:MAG: ATP-binding protein [Flavobacteriales bacterium]